MKLVKNTLLIVLSIYLFTACKHKADKIEFPFDWKNATVYFMLTDRFYNGNTDNDVNFDRNTDTKELRKFTGGDLAGITKKIKEGYFNNLGVDALWFSPVNEQIHGYVDEGQGRTYAFHGYWIRDWTSIEPNWGTDEELKELVKTAHKNGIRVILDVIINHTGPVTDQDPVWPSDWVRTEPQCRYQDYESTVFCTLVRNLPDIITEQTVEVELPPQLVEKWKKEGRYEKEIYELNAFFERTGYPRTPRYYIIKWLTDYVRKYGIDGFRVDTVKHTEPDVWKDLATESHLAFEEWKSKNNEPIQDGQDFFIVAETYGYAIMNGLDYDFGDTIVNYFDNGFDSQINFGFKGDANMSYEQLFSRYSEMLNNGELKDYTVMNYISSHDDGWPFDQKRERTYESANKLMLSPGQVQIYYGDETARPLLVEGAIGDVNLRSKMNWGENPELLMHWQKLGKFRNSHPAVGAGVHNIISETPYSFSRSYQNNELEDVVIIAINEPGRVKIDVSEYFISGTPLKDAYTGQNYRVTKGYVEVDSESGVVLLEAI